MEDGARACHGPADFKIDAIVRPLLRGMKRRPHLKSIALFVYLDVLEIPVLLHLDLVLTDVVVVES